MAHTTTVGRLLLDEALPEEMRGKHPVLDKAGIKALFQELAKDHPERYRDVSHALSELGRSVIQDEGSYSFSLRHLQKSPIARQLHAELQNKLSTILNDETLTSQQRQDRIVHATGQLMGPQAKLIYEQGLKDNNPAAHIIKAGMRGGPLNLASLQGGDLLYSDSKARIIPIPVMRSYTEGLTPAEYWAGTYGARQGVIATKLNTADAGFLAKQLNQLSHRLIITGHDSKEPYETTRGMPVDTTDPDNEGALLAHDVKGYPRNTVLTAKVLRELNRKGVKRLLVRSPTVGGPPEGGLYSADVGVREHGWLPGRGESIGQQAAQALSEPISQGSLAVKHSGGVAGQSKALTGFEAINSLLQAPKTMKGGGTHSEQDGLVQKIQPATAGGTMVTINDQEHYVPEGLKLKVKVGERVEAGDLLSDGLPHQGQIVQHKGIGEGRRYFAHAFRQAMQDAGLRVHRRNVELIARGLIDHVELTKETDGHVPGEIVSYQDFEHHYQPRAGSMKADPRRLRNHYLEKPYLHYSIGTKLRPSVLKELAHFGIKEVEAHPEPPPFQPTMVRAAANLQHDPDPLTRMYGSSLKGGLLDAAHRGAVSDEAGTSFVPSLAKGVDFGHAALVHTPEPGLDPASLLPIPKAAPAPAAPVPTLSPGLGQRLLNLLHMGKTAAASASGSSTLKSDGVTPSNQGPAKAPAAPTAGPASATPSTLTPAPTPAAAPTPPPQAPDQPYGPQTNPLTQGVGAGEDEPITPAQPQQQPAQQPQRQPQRTLQPAMQPNPAEQRMMNYLMQGGDIASVTHLAAGLEPGAWADFSQKARWKDQFQGANPWLPMQAPKDTAQGGNYHQYLPGYEHWAYGGFPGAQGGPGAYQGNGMQPGGNQAGSWGGPGAAPWQQGQGEGSEVMPGANSEMGGQESQPLTPQQAAQQRAMEQKYRRELDATMGGTGLIQDYGKPATNLLGLGAIGGGALGWAGRGVGKTLQYGSKFLPAAGGASWLTGLAGRGVSATGRGIGRVAGAAGKVLGPLGTAVDIAEVAPTVFNTFRGGPEGEAAKAQLRAYADEHARRMNNPDNFLDAVGTFANPVATSLGTVRNLQNLPGATMDMMEQFVDANQNRDRSATLETKYNMRRQLNPLVAKMRQGELNQAEQQQYEQLRQQLAGQGGDQPFKPYAEQRAAELAAIPQRQQAQQASQQHEGGKLQKMLAAKPVEQMSQSEQWDYKIVRDFYLQQGGDPKAFPEVNPASMRAVPAQQAPQPNLREQAMQALTPRFMRPR